MDSKTLSFLIIDDEVLRRSNITEHVNSITDRPKIDLATTYSEAFKMITQNKYDYIFLDHDLGDKSDKQTGYELAKELKYSINKNSVVIVTSLNPVGVCNILAELPNANYCPTYLMKEQLKKIVQLI